MTRMQKKCLIASSGLHVLLALLVLFGSAFFVAKEKPLSYPKLQFYPSKWIEGALAGGGGNPNIARTEDVQKGVSRPLPPPAAPPQAKPQEVTPPPPPKPVEPKVEVSKVPPTKSLPKPEELQQSKVPEKPTPKFNVDLNELKPVQRTQADKAKAKADAEARERAAEAAAQSRQMANARRKLGEKLSNQVSTMSSGFESGTKVDVGGLGGEAFADYGALVQTIYQNAWKLPMDLSDDDFITQVRITIARDGRVVVSEIQRKSGNSTMDRSVQRALDKVKADGLPPFPPHIRDADRTFKIEFNLKTRKLLG
jgi:outer membrane biosynthesis protein TonB